MASGKAAATRAAGASAVAVGVGTTQDWDGIARSLRQARYALRLARSRRAELVEFADLGVVDLLFGAQESAALADLSAHVLGPLERYDREHDGELVRSLAEFLTHNGHWEAAAARLGVHRHSLRYRVRKIEQLTDRSLDSAHDRTEFLLAALAYGLAGVAVTVLLRPDPLLRARRLALDAPVEAAAEALDAALEDLTL